MTTIILSTTSLIFPTKKTYLVMFKLTITSMIGMMMINPSYHYETKMMFMDELSFSMMMMTLYLMILVQLSSSSEEPYNYQTLLSTLSLILLLTFLMKSSILFYLFFEASLIPTFLLILGWGYQPERMMAYLYFFFYTLVASLPLLILILSLSQEFLISIFLMDLTLKSTMTSTYTFIFLMIAFMVKLPAFFFHIWLPKAHLEAPVVGSMILAGVLLKLGSYGIYRTIHLIMTKVNKWNPTIFSLGVISLVYVGLMSSRLTDMKTLIAYSSVSHMGLMMSSMSTYLYVSLKGSIIMMVFHAMNSSGMFYVVNSMYSRSGSRNMFLNKGSTLSQPWLSMSTFILCTMNFSAPPSASLISELMFIFSLMLYSWLSMIMFPVGSFLGVVFTMILFTSTQLTEESTLKTLSEKAEYKEMHCTMMHLMILATFILSVGKMLT